MVTFRSNDPQNLITDYELHKQCAIPHTYIDDILSQLHQSTKFRIKYEKWSNENKEDPICKNLLIAYDNDDNVCVKITNDDRRWLFLRYLGQLGSFGATPALSIDDTRQTATGSFRLEPYPEQSEDVIFR